MSKHKIIVGIAFWIICFLSIASSPLFSKQDDEVEKLRTSQEVLRQMHHGNQDRLLGELERSVAQLEKRMDRFEERFKTLEHDLDELERKL